MAGEAATSEVKMAKRARRRAKNPYWGFGWVGWLGVVLLIALIVAAYRGWDPVLSFQALAFTLLSIKSNMNVSVALMMTDLWLHWLLLGPLSLVTCAAIFLWAPKRSARRRIWAMGLILTGVMAPIVYPIVLFRWHPFTALVSWIPGGGDGFIFEVCVGILALSIVWLTSRSLLLLLAWIAWLGLGAAVNFDLMQPWVPSLWYWEEIDRYLLLAIWNGVIIAVTLRWAVHAHMARLIGKRCPECDYDLTGLESLSTCPECGADVLDISP